jgi:hypothetical protein
MEPIVTDARPTDPELERALFFMDLEMAELTAIIPQADPPDPKSVY